MRSAIAVNGSFLNTHRSATKNATSRVMKEADMENYRALLMAKRQEILHHSHQREDICIVQSNELLETVQSRR